MLSIRNVSKSYARGKVKAVDCISLEVNPGEIFGFLGPNGAGKTTTIKMIAGILRPDSGEVLIDGFNIETRPMDAKRRIGYVPDSHDIYDRLTGIEYLNFIADVYEVPPNERKAAIGRYLEMFEIQDAAGELIKSYSHGMKQKLMLTGALLHNPSLWLLDEPLTGLDPRAAHLLKEQMREHCKRGSAVFFSTHILEVAERLCDRLAIISKGRIIAAGTLAQLRSSAFESLESIFLELTEGERKTE